MTSEASIPTDPKPSTFNVQRFSLPFSERRLLLMGLDLLAVNSALLLALALRPEHGLDWGLLIQRPLWFLLLSALWLPLAYAFDAYDLRVAGRFATAAPAVLKAGAVTCAIYLLIPYLPPALPASRFSLFAFPLSVLLLLLAGRGLYVLALAQPLFQRRALIVGAGWAGRNEVTGRQGDKVKGRGGESNKEKGKKKKVKRAAQISAHQRHQRSIPNPKSEIRNSQSEIPR